MLISAFSLRNLFWILNNIDDLFPSWNSHLVLTNYRIGIVESSLIVPSRVSISWSRASVIPNCMPGEWLRHTPPCNGKSTTTDMVHSQKKIQLGFFKFFNCFDCLQKHSSYNYSADNGDHWQLLFWQSRQYDMKKGILNQNKAHWKSC